MDNGIKCLYVSLSNPNLPPDAFASRRKQCLVICIDRANCRDSYGLNAGDQCLVLWLACPRIFGPICLDLFQEMIGGRIWDENSRSHICRLGFLSNGN